MSEHMPWQYNDGGRKAAGYKGDTGDCVVRAIAIATELPYREVYAALHELGKVYISRKRKKGIQYDASPRNGVYRAVYDKYLLSKGWLWVPTVLVGVGCKIHLVEGELPAGRLIVKVSRHITCVLNGVVHDTWDPQRRTYLADGRVTYRCIYGYFVKGDNL